MGQAGIRQLTWRDGYKRYQKVQFHNPFARNFKAATARKFPVNASASCRRFVRGHPCERGLWCRTFTGFAGTMDFLSDKRFLDGIRGYER